MKADKENRASRRSSPARMGRRGSRSRLLEVEQSAPSGFKRTRFSCDALGRGTGSHDGIPQTLFVRDGLGLLREDY